MKKIVVFWAIVLALFGALPFGASADVVDQAVTKIGFPYSLDDPSAVGPNKFDCSGLVQWSYKQVGVNLPRTTWDQQNSGPRIQRAQLQRGDLVFFDPDLDGKPSHVGIFIGSGQYGGSTFIAADYAKTSKYFIHYVEFDNIDDGYWKPIFLFGVHINGQGNGGGGGGGQNNTNPVPLYRYRSNWGRGDRFYTTNFGELGYGGSGGWVYEGVQCHVYSSQVSGTIPLYRYSSPSLGLHFYTTQNVNLNGIGYHLEGIQCYVYGNSICYADPSITPLFRYYNTWNNSHFYTTNWRELGNGGGDWRYEGIECNVRL